MTITQKTVETWLSPHTPKRSEVEMLQAQNAMLLAVINDYQLTIYNQANLIAQLTSEDYAMANGVVH